MNRNQLLEMFPIGDPQGRRILFDPVSAIGAGIGGVASLFGGLIGSNAAHSAADIQSRNAQNVAQLGMNAATGAQSGVAGASQSAQAGEGSAVERANQSIETGTSGANQTLMDFFQSELGNLSPYLAAGQQGLQQLTADTGPGGSLTQQFTAPTAAEAAQTPGYQFTLDQGTQAINRSAAATGLSGGTLKALTQYGQGLASTTYQQSYNNSLNSFNTNRAATMQNLSALLGQGQFGTSQAQSAMQNTGGAIAANTAQSGYGQSSNLMNAAQYQGNVGMQAAQLGGQFGLQGAQIAGTALTGGANAQAAGQVGAANAWQGALGGVANAGQYYSMSQLMNPYSSSGAPAGFQPYSSAPPMVQPAPYVPYNPGPVQSLPPGFGGVTPAPTYNQSSYGTAGGQY